MTEEKEKGIIKEPGTNKRKSAMGSFFGNVWGIAKVFLISAIIILPIRAYVAQPFFVRGSSMVPNFHDGEYLIIDELSYNTGLRTPSRGDVVVFRYPLDPTQYYIKRIIGLPGERIVVYNNQITITNKQYPNGIQLSEQYLPPSDQTHGNVDITLKNNEYFVLGDNRDNSSDSRIWGPVPKQMIIGRAWLRLFPVVKASTFNTPNYGGLVQPMATSSPSQ